MDFTGIIDWKKPVIIKGHIELFQLAARRQALRTPGGSGHAFAVRGSCPGRLRVQDLRGALRGGIPGEVGGTVGNRGPGGRAGGAPWQ